MIQAFLNTEGFDEKGRRKGCENKTSSAFQEWSLVGFKILYRPLTRNRTKATQPWVASCKLFRLLLKITTT